jgi:hypothetical protein
VKFDVLTGSAGLRKWGARLRSLWWAPKVIVQRKRKRINVFV